MTDGIIKSKRWTVLERDGGRCHYCSTPLTIKTATMDHIWPKALGGSNANANLVAACQSCNTSHGDDTDKCRCTLCVAAMRTEVAAQVVARIQAEYEIATVAEAAGFKWSPGGWMAHRSGDVR